MQKSGTSSAPYAEDASNSAEGSKNSTPVPSSDSTSTGVKPRFAGTFAVYDGPKGGLVLVTQQEGGPVEHKHIPGGVVRAVMGDGVAGKMMRRIFGGGGAEQKFLDDMESLDAVASGDESAQGNNGKESENPGRVGESTAGDDTHSGRTQPTVVTRNAAGGNHRTTHWSHRAIG